MAKRRSKPADTDWPPAVAHKAAIEIGDGSRFHYLATAEALRDEGILAPHEIPGDPSCEYQWCTCGTEDDGKMWQAVRLGERIALTLLEVANVVSCVPAKFTPR